MAVAEKDPFAFAGMAVEESRVWSMLTLPQGLAVEGR